jgi:hypothetical protein
MDRLATLYGTTYSQKEAEGWASELNKAGVDDALLMEAVELLRGGEKTSYKPTLNTFLFYLRDAQAIRREKDWQLKKDEDKQYRHLSPGGILERGRSRNPYTQAAIEITRDLLAGKVDKATWQRKHSEYMRAHRAKGALVA